METRLKVYFSGNMWITPADSQVRSIPSLAMNFDTLFQDLENQLERELDAELINRLDDEERERRAKLTLRERLLSIQRIQPAIELAGMSKDGRKLGFSIKNVGKDWVALDVHEPAELRGQVIAPIHMLNNIEIPAGIVRESLGTPVGEISDHDLRSLGSTPRLAEKVNLAFVLRDLSRRRKRVTIYTSLGNAAGTIDHVGVDHLDLTSDSHREIVVLQDVLFVQMN
ncbi:hypothetical protein M2113_001550 [Aurantimicrobium minutum]|nr:hypothetical protein [Aurantimicrobium minutum]